MTGADNTSLRNLMNWTVTDFYPGGRATGRTLVVSGALTKAT